VICLLLESVTDARRFFTEARQTTPRKPVIAVVGGRTGAGQRAAVSHTAALGTDDAILDAALRQAGVVRVRTGLQALDGARALASQPVPRGPRVAVVTNSGGTGVELTDLLADEGLAVPELSGPLQDELRALLPEYGSARNPVDMTPAWRLFTTVYPAAIEMLARSGEVDAVVPVLLQRSASPEVAGGWGPGPGVRLLGGAARGGPARGGAAGGGGALLRVAGADRAGGRDRRPVRGTDGAERAGCRGGGEGRRAGGRAAGERGRARGRAAGERRRAGGRGTGPSRAARTVCGDPPPPAPAGAAG
jgi:hypothetical protein